MKKIFNVILWSILTGVMALLLIVSSVAGYLCMNVYSAAVHMAFGTSDFKTVNDDNAAAEDYYKTSYQEKVDGDLLFQKDGEIIEEAEGEGAVLLWNKDNALPLAKNSQVSLFGRGSYELVLSGSGSGYVSSVSQATGKSVSVDLKTALESRSLGVNAELWKVLDSSSNKPTRPDTACTEWQRWYVNEFGWSTYAGVSGTFSSYKDAAIVTITRTGGEYSDLHYNYSGATTTGTMESTPEEGGYLGLTDEEEAIFDNIKSSGVFNKVIVLLNTGNPLQMQDFEKYEDLIDACMWIGQVGTTGANAVADLLVGNVTPSGRLSDTFAYNLNSAPSTVNDGSYVYSNPELVNGLVSASGCAANRYNTYMVYQEGIYVGYKYYETRYYDSVVNSTFNATSGKGAKHSQGGWSYDGEVAFPFGYGLSYTSFEWSGFKCRKVENDNYEVSVTVRNTGDVEGKDVVQVYLQKPYTQYDIDNKIEKAAVELVGFAKTGSIKPGASETVTVLVDKENFKTYDANSKKTYIIEKSDNYYLTAGTDSHVAVNNIIKAQGKGDVSQNVMFGNVKSEVIGAHFAERISLDNDFTTYSKSTQTGEEITNRLDSGDINKYDGAGNNNVTYLSRSNWDATYPTAAPSLVLTSQMVEDLKDASTNLDDMVALLKSGQSNRYYPDVEDEMPVYSKFVSGGKTADVKSGDLVAIMFMDAPLYPELSDDETVIDGKPYVQYWTERWNQLLDQMTFEEQALMCANAYHLLNGATSVNLPPSRQENGPVGITKRVESNFAIPNKDVADWNWVAYPCNPVLASTFNTDLIRRVGEHMSEDMLYLGYNGIYGPGANMHRTPFGGRNFEYPSEDSFLAGEAAYAVSAGIESKGCLAYAKHFALNDTETNRRHVQIWSNEQATREIYLKPFERAFAEGGASATMNSFTRIGTRWSGSCYALMTTVLRDEWGWDGINISDWQQNNPGPMTWLDGIMGGTDSFDGNGTGDKFAPYKDIPAVAQALRTASQRIIHNVVKTNAMNGMTLNTRVVEVVVWWKAAFYALDAVFGVFTAACAGMLIATIVLKKKNAKKEA